MRRLLCIGVLGLASACNSILGIGDFDVGPADDVPPPSDTFVPPDLAPGCFGVLAPYCDPIDSTSNVSVSSMDTGSNCPKVFQPSTGGGEVCVVTGGNLIVDTTITVTGPRPLMLVAIDSITISSTIDASSRLRGQIGAGAVDQTCTAPAGQSQNGGGGGGGGGGFGDVGADGGAGAQGAPPGLGGPVLQTPTFLRPGCAAGAGGSGSTVGSGGIGGVSGGVVYLVAGRIEISPSGAVLASGAGGAGANQLGGNRGGGGGGGSGGMIALEAMTITVDGILQANGGGGGGGADSGQGMDGADGTTQPFDSPATGGNSEAPGKGGPGGSGGAGIKPPQPGMTPIQGGGGGGGGGAVGYVWVRGQLSGGGNGNVQSSPPPTQVP